MRVTSAAGGVQHQEQQDAQEFTHFLLDAAHEELLALRKAAAAAGALPAAANGGDAGGAGAGGGADDWAQVRAAGRWGFMSCRRGLVSCVAWGIIVLYMCRCVNGRCAIMGGAGRAHVCIFACRSVGTFG